MDIILQGPIYPETNEIIDIFLKTSFVDKIIVSCWESCPSLNFQNHKVKVVRSFPYKNPGIGNRNLQIQSTQAGLKEVEGDVCGKFRSDQIISLESLEMMNAFFQKYKEPQIRYEDGTGPKYQMFVCGDFWPIPFHPRDHVFWSDTQSLKKLFFIPYDSNPKVEGEQYYNFTRAEAYIGAFYYSLFDKNVKEMVDNPKVYLVDGAPKHQEAINLSLSLQNKVFKVFPRINLNWPKNGIYGYRYDSQSMWERWHDESW